jgi:hypothetical protein
LRRIYQGSPFVYGFRHSLLLKYYLRKLVILGHAKCSINENVQ